MKFILGARDIREIQSVVNDWMGLRLTADQAKEFVESDYDLVCDIARNGVYDTCTREWIMKVIGQRLVGRNVPTFADSQKVSETFYADLYEAAIKAGIQVIYENQSNS